MNNIEMMQALKAVAQDRGVDEIVLLQALADALVTAYKRFPESAEEAEVVIDPDSGDIRVMAQELDEDYNIIREWDDTPENFGRIAAQTAKQVITQRIREVERDVKFAEYSGREGDIVTGIVSQADHRYTLLDLGKVEALLPQSEQAPMERYEHSKRLKAYIVEVRNTQKGPQIVVSRTHPGLVEALFRLEVPEIEQGVVEIKAIAREPGRRTKIAVYSTDENVDPVGSCVGASGGRVREIMTELRGEKIDIVPYTEDPVEYVRAALSPAKNIQQVQCDYETGSALVIVPDQQLSLAIGKEGQNARLAARLTGWRIDIQAESEISGSDKVEDESTTEQEQTEDSTDSEQNLVAAQDSPEIVSEAEDAAKEDSVKEETTAETA